MRVVQKKSKWFKATTVLASIAMLAGLIAGCGGGNNGNTAEPANTPASTATTAGEADSDKPASWISDEPLEFTALFGDNAGYKQDWLFLKEIPKRTNVTLKLQVVPDKDFKDKRNLVLASGEAPDIILKTWPDEIKNYSNPDTLVPIEDIIDMMPNFQKRLESTNFQAEYDAFYKVGDGKHYLLPGWGKNAEQWQVLFYRADLFKKHNIAEPKTFDELAAALKVLKEAYPESAPLTNRFGEGLLLGPISRNFGTNAGWSLPNGYTYNYDTKEWYFAPTSDGYKEMVKYLAKLAADGLLDKEAFTQDGNVFDQKLTTGVSFAGYGWLGEELKYNADGKKNVGPEYELKWLDPLSGPATPGKPLTNSGKRGGGGLAINAKAKNNPNFDKMVKFIDWLWYSEEGQTLANWGVEGVTYQVVDGKKQLMDDIKNWDRPDAPKELRKEFGFNVDQFNFASPDDFYANTLNPEYKAFFDKLAQMQATPVDDPSVPLNDEEVEKTKLLITKLNDYTKQQLYKFVLGAADVEKDWDAYVKECENKGSKELIDIVNTAWKRSNP